VYLKIEIIPKLKKTNKIFKKVNITVGTSTGSGS
jgi:hypothetical protein